MPIVYRRAGIVAIALLVVLIGWQVHSIMKDSPADVPEDPVAYGRELIAHTSRYLGPSGIVQATTNGLNCQNCHLDAGTRPYGNNYKKVAGNYPRFRYRSGTVETLEKRINDCIQRSLNGIALDTASREMHAIRTYILSVGTDSSSWHTAGLPALPFLSRAADPEQGTIVYRQHCARCHGEHGEGQLAVTSGDQYIYPPLWGDNSYNTGAGLFRLSNFASYVWHNMPYGISYQAPELTVEEAWDVAAYVNSQPRPHKVFPHDWPDVAHKPVDHPFGPYADLFTESQHKYGPYAPIRDFYARQAP